MATGDFFEGTNTALSWVFVRTRSPVTALHRRFCCQLWVLTQLS